MCGIFGFISNNGNGPSLRQLERVALATESRGPHAFGMAWIDSRGRLKMFKQSGSISDHRGILELALDARMLVGHCRYATHGNPNDNTNNHPHPCDGGWLVHNGVIGRHRQIAAEYGLAPIGQCDSEVLALLIEELDGSLLERSIRAAQIAAGRPLAMMALWRSPKRLVAVRAGNPLHVAESPDATWLASLRNGLPAGAYSLRDETALSLTIEHGRVKLHAVDAAEIIEA